ncbi:hypothetical protein BDN70DRAFT_768248, partial [Pholiota conissans]
KNWASLLEKWVAFERGVRNNGVSDTSLITKPRPTEVAAWMKNARKFNRLPKIAKASDFIITWRQWWVAMQPDCRKGDDAWPLLRDLPDGADWSKLSYSGPNGFFLIILSLMWW